MLLERKTEVFRRIQQMEAHQDVDGLMSLVKEEISNLSVATGYGRLPASFGQFTVGEYLRILDSNPLFTARFLIIEGLLALRRIRNAKAFDLFIGLVGLDLVWKESTIAIGEVVVMTLGETGDSRAVAHLLPLLRRKELIARRVASDALAKLGGEEARKALIKAVKNQRDERTRDRMKGALSKIEPLMQEASPQSEGRKRSWWRF